MYYSQATYNKYKYSNSIASIYEGVLIWLTYITWRWVHARAVIANTGKLHCRRTVFAIRVRTRFDRSDSSVFFIAKSREFEIEVDCNILLDKLYGVGVRGIAHEWFQSYLRNRNQYVDIDYVNETSREICTVRSEVQPVTDSIPQGSVIGCALFIIYINDLPKIFNEPWVMFADDCSLLFSCTNEKSLCEKLNNIMSDAACWMNDHNLEINFTKLRLCSSDLARN